jgi:hypothetical protein
MPLRNRQLGVVRQSHLTIRHRSLTDTLDANAAISWRAASPKDGHCILTANRAAECITPALLKDQNIPKGVTVELHDYPGALDGRIAASTCAI